MKAMNIYATETPVYELDHDRSILNAKRIFESIYEGAEFLPRAPDPEDNTNDCEYLMQQDEPEASGAEKTD